MARRDELRGGRRDAVQRTRPQRRGLPLRHHRTHRRPVGWRNLDRRHPRGAQRRCARPRGHHDGNHKPRWLDRPGRARRTQTAGRGRGGVFDRGTARRDHPGHRSGIERRCADGGVRRRSRRARRVRAHARRGLSGVHRCGSHSQRGCGDSLRVRRLSTARHRANRGDRCGAGGRRRPARRQP